MNNQDLANLPRLCTSREMRQWDQNAIENLGLPGRVLMETAAGAVVQALVSLLQQEGAQVPVVVCCGAGNNGGDGYAVARLLENRGFETIVTALGEPGGEDARANLAAWRKFGKTVDFGKEPAEAKRLLDQCGVVVDALFGTGLNRPLEGEAASLIAIINDSPAPIKIAVDLPSGVNSDTGAILGCAVSCTHTVTFQVGKIGCYQHPGAALAGEIQLAPISIPTPWEPEQAATYLLTESFVSGLLPSRPPHGHKGTFGHLLSLCGSAGMGGAAMLAGLAALKSGCGLVTSGVPLCLRDGFLDTAPELMTLASEEGEEKAFEGQQADFFIAAARSRDALLLGCGIAQGEKTRDFVKKIAEVIEKPLLIDADGLNLLNGPALQARPYPTVITPHPGELSALSGLSKEELNSDRVGHARRLAVEWQVVLLLKGAKTVVAAPTGEVFINPTGDQGLATAGSGDVLSGIIGGLLAQGLSPLDAALVGAYWHGLARDLKARELSSACFTASDILAGMNQALQKLEEKLETN